MNDILLSNSQNKFCNAHNEIPCHHSVTAIFLYKQQRPQITSKKKALNSQCIPTLRHSAYQLFHTITHSSLKPPCFLLSKTACPNVRNIRYCVQCWCILRACVVCVRVHVCWSVPFEKITCRNKCDNKSANNSCIPFLSVSFHGVQNSCQGKRTSITTKKRDATFSSPVCTCGRRVRRRVRKRAKRER